MPATNTRVCMSTYFSSDGCPWVPESQGKYTKDLPRNCVLYGSNVRGFCGQFSPVILLTQNDLPFLYHTQSLVLGCHSIFWKLRQIMGTETLTKCLQPEQFL